MPLPGLPRTGIADARNDAHASVFMTLTDVRKDNLLAAARLSGESARYAESAMWRGDEFVLHDVPQSAGSRLCSADQAISRCLDQDPNDRVRCTS